MVRGLRLALKGCVWAAPLFAGQTVPSWRWTRPCPNGLPARHLKPAGLWGRGEVMVALPSEGGEGLGGVTI